MAGLSEKAVVAKLTIGMFSFSQMDKRMTSRVHDELLHNTKRAGKWLKEKINRDDVRAVLKISDDARNYYRRMSRPFGDDNSRLLPVQRVLEYTKTMGEFAREFQIEKTNIINNWENILRLQEDRLGADFIAESYPKKDKLEKIIRLEWRILPVPDWASIHDRDHIIFKIEEEVARELMEKAREDQRVMLNESVAYLWQRLYESVERMANACASKSSKVYDVTIKDLERENEIVRELNFTDDYEIEAICTEIEAKLTGFNAKQIRRNLDLKLRLGRSAEVVMDRIKGRINLGVLQAA